MDDQQFVDRLRNALRNRLSGFSLWILKDKLPTSVKFLIISADFDGISRGARIEFIAEMVQTAFGLPLTFRPMGRALTQAEFESENAESDSMMGYLATTADDGTAAKPL